MTTVMKNIACMNIERLKTLFEKSTDKYGDAKRMETTYQTLYNLIYKGTVCRVDLLERIAAFYRVPVGYFFDETVMFPTTMPTIESATTDLETVLAGAHTSDSSDSCTLNNLSRVHTNGNSSTIINTLSETISALKHAIETCQEENSQLIKIIDKLTNKYNEK